MDGFDRPLMYFLDEQGEPVGAAGFGLDDPRLIEWYEHSWEPGPRCRRVAQNTVDDYWVSTVFLSHDHQFGNGPPVLWETMVFRRSDDAAERYCERYTSRAAAERRHAEIVAALLAGKKVDELEKES